MYTNPLKNLTKYEWILWISSMLIMAISFIFVKEKNYLNLIMSLIGATTLIFIAKGDIMGHILGIIFAILYGIISYSFRYYGEMITYVFMTLPMSIFSLISWFKNPHSGSRNEVQISKLSSTKLTISIFVSIALTIVMYFALKALDTPNLIFSTISITTSALAAMLCIYRSKYCSLAYAANDIVLIILWILASLKNMAYIPVAINFIVFFINDLYGFYNWTKMMKKQTKHELT